MKNRARKIKVWSWSLKAPPRKNAADIFKNAMGSKSRPWPWPSKIINFNLKSFTSTLKKQHRYLKKGPLSKSLRSFIFSHNTPLFNLNINIQTFPSLSQKSLKLHSSPNTSVTHPQNQKLSLSAFKSATPFDFSLFRLLAHLSKTFTPTKYHRNRQRGSYFLRTSKTTSTPTAPL